MSINWIPVLPPALILLVTLGLLALLGFGSWILTTKNVPVKWIAILGGIRLLIILLFAVCMLQPIVSWTRSVKESQTLLVLLDVSQSMGIADPATKVTRLQEGIRWMESSGFASKIEKKSHVYWFAFDQNARSMDPGGLDSLQATSATTRFSESLSSAWEHYRQTASAAGAASTGSVVLFSDGNDFSNQDIVELAKSLGLAIYTLAPSSSKEKGGAADVAVANVQTPRRVLLGSETRFLVTLRQEGMENKPIKLKLKEEGKDVVPEQNVTFSTGQQERQVSIACRPSEAGIKEYEVEVITNPPDALQDNNRCKVSVQVIGARNEVLYLEDSWRWEFKFLRRIIEDDPSFSFTSFLARGDSTYVQYVEPDRKVSLGNFPQTKAELERFDTFILGDVNPKKWPKALIPAFNNLIVEGGKSLIVIAGPNIGDFVGIPELASLLPVEVTPDTANPIEGPIKVRISPDGMASPIFFCVNPALWNEIQPFDQVYPSLRKRPGATVLLEATEKAAPDGTPLAVIAEQTVGRGRVLFVGTDTLWKWQTTSVQSENANTPYTVFWQQALRGLTPAHLSTGSVNLWLQPNHSRYETGDTMTIRAEVQSDRPLAKPKIQSKLTFPDKKQIPLDFSPHPTLAGIYQAQIEAGGPGQYRVAAELLAEGKVVADSIIAIDVARSMAEMNSIRVNEVNLARIASDTGGKKIDRNDRKTWPMGENLPDVTVQKTRVFDLWNNFTLIILLVLLLGTDWLLRLLRGFV
jgi:hypothetical protein